MEMKKKYTILICDDSKEERKRFYERQYDYFNIYGVIKRKEHFIEVDPVDSVEKLHQLIRKLKNKKRLPDIILLDLFYKRAIPNVDEREEQFVKELLEFKQKFKEIKTKVNDYLIPSGVELLKTVRSIDQISPEELPICVYTDKNFNFLLSEDFNKIYKLDPSFIHKDRDFEEPNSRITPAIEYFRLLKIIERNKSIREKTGKKIFISHGHSAEWLKVQVFLEKKMFLGTIELAQQANKGRTIIKKLDDASSLCCYAIIVMSGDDFKLRKNPRTRENVMHEIGFFQGRYGLKNVCIIFEEGTSIPTNLSGIIYLPYKSGNIQKVFPGLIKEIQHLSIK
jgi:hypothetical protein